MLPFVTVCYRLSFSVTLWTPEGIFVNRNRVTVTGDIQVTDQLGTISIFEPIAAIDHIGGVSGTEDTQGHYLCDIQTRNKRWFKTNDNKKPIPISKRQVSKQSAVVLYKKQHI